ncbi:MAG: YHS domain-containing (seleno)protein [Pseudomonadota bacterium]
MTHLTRRQTFAFAAGAAALAAGAASAAEPPVFSAKPSRFSFADVMAIRGADAVAYFTQGEAVMGSSDFTSTYNGAVWAFASAENKAMFDANPDAFAPQYGGYCAFAVASGYTASTDPEAWTIHDGKLYLNFSKGVRSRWLQDVPGNIQKGDANWPSVLG